MEFHDPDGRSEASVAPIERQDVPRRRDPGLLLLFGLAGFVVVHGWQLWRFGWEGGAWTGLVMQLGFVLSTATATAGILTVVLKRWVIPDLLAECQTTVAEHGDAAGVES